MLIIPDSLELSFGNKFNVRKVDVVYIAVRRHLEHGIQSFNPYLECGNKLQRKFGKKLKCHDLAKHEQEGFEEI